MIVVDTNIIHYCWVHGQHTELAQAVRRQDPDWHAPLLWRSEMRNVLTAYLRRGLLSRTQISSIIKAPDGALIGNEHMIADDLVLDIVSSSALTAYDAEFVALATILDVPLVTADRAVPSLALLLGFGRIWRHPHRHRMPRAPHAACAQAQLGRARL